MEAIQVNLDVAASWPSTRCDTVAENESARTRGSRQAPPWM